MTVLWLSKTKASYRITLQVSPNAKKSEIASTEGEALRIRLQALPVDGKANDALIQFIAKKLRIPKKCVIISHGLNSKRKCLEITSPELTQEIIEQYLLTP